MQTNYAQPSRLQLLQADFQKRQLRQKEEKLLSLHQQSQKAAEQRLDRITQNSGGKTRTEGTSVRDFFNGKRGVSQNNNTNNNMAPKQEPSYQTGSYANKMHNNQAQRVMGLPPKKNSAGRDKSNPLAPIQRDSSAGRKGSRVKKLTEESRRNSLPSLNNDKSGSINSGPYSDGNYSGLSDSGMSNDNVPDSSRSSKQKQSVRRKQITQKRHQQAEAYDNESSEEDVKPKNVEKLTDFQKWQLEQDEAKRKRLEKARQTEKPKSRSIDFDRESGRGGENSANEEDNFAAEIARKERELLAQIEQRQRELEQMQLEKQRDEEEEAREEERRRKEEALLEKRRRKLEAEERKREDEDYRRRLAEEEAEERQRLEEEEARARQNARRRKTPPDAFPTKPVTVKHKTKPQNQPQAQRYNKRPATPPDEPEDDYPKTPQDPAAFYVQAIADAEEDNVHLDLRPCPNCGRKFNADRLQKHAKACKNITKKRKVLDPRKMRMEGTEAAKFIGQVDKKPVKQKNKVDWRKQHKEFIESIRYAKKCTEIEAQGGSVLDLPPPPKSENLDYKQCPYCKRKFNPDTADRHIPKCKDIKARPAPPKKKR